MHVTVSSELLGTKYEKYDKSPLTLPENVDSWPSFAQLRKHLIEFDLP
jgi:hypothetical protein